MKSRCKHDGSDKKSLPDSFHGRFGPARLNVRASEPDPDSDPQSLGFITRICCQYGRQRNTNQRFNFDLNSGYPDAPVSSIDHRLRGWAIKRPEAFFRFQVRADSVETVRR